MDILCHVKMANGRLDLNLGALTELKNQGLDNQGKWIGFNMKILYTYLFRPVSSLVLQGSLTGSNTYQFNRGLLFIHQVFRNYLGISKINLL